MYDVVYEDIQENEEYKKIIMKVLVTCFEKENLDGEKWYINVMLTTPKIIQEINKDFRGIDKQTDVLSFPMFEKYELDKLLEEQKDENILGDIVVSIEKVQEQAKEYNHSFERELSYMIVHGFYHLMGYDHMEEIEKKEMRIKEEEILDILDVGR